MISLMKFFHLDESEEKAKAMQENIQSSCILRHEAKRITRETEAFEMLAASIEKRKAKHGLSH
jgi:hypothetical protein